MIRTGLVSHNKNGIGFASKYIDKGIGLKGRYKWMSKK
jgi:hypothetical protein